MDYFSLHERRIEAFTKRLQVLRNNVAGRMSLEQLITPPNAGRNLNDMVGNRRGTASAQLRAHHTRFVRVATVGQ